jgi:hypothetical protein
LPLLVLANNVTARCRNSEQQLENLVRELKAALANHMPVRILIANQVTARCRNSEQQLENLVRELKAAPVSNMPVRILLANHVTARCRFRAAACEPLENLRPICQFKYISQSCDSQIQDSEQQLENLVRELKAAPANRMAVRILLANHVTVQMQEFSAAA